MIKLGETSPLALPIILLKMIFPSVRQYYRDTDRPTDGYEHFHTGLILSLITCFFALRFTPWLLLAIIPEFLAHVVWKELWHDRKKNIGQPLTKKVDLITRTMGFVPALILAIFVIW